MTTDKNTELVSGNWLQVVPSNYVVDTFGIDYRPGSHYIRTTLLKGTFTQLLHSVGKFNEFIPAIGNVSTMKRISGNYGLLGLVGIIALFAFLSTGSADIKHPLTKGNIDESYGLRPARFIQSHLNVRDTIFTTDSLYLDTDLEKQKVTLHFRSGRTKSFLISSGNPNIPKGIATPTGIFTVQGKQPMAISRQFDDAKLYHWIGVYGGVGFHGLEGNGYYWNLGNRPSSHGCIRMSREEVTEMYSMVHVGAPILVHKGEPARVIAFCDPADTLDAVVIDTARAKLRGLGNERIRALYDGQFFENPAPRLVHLAGTRVSWRIEEGLESKIPKQNIPKTLPLPTLREVVDRR